MRLLKRWLCLFMSLFILYVLAYYIWKMHLSLNDLERNTQDIYSKALKHSRRLSPENFKDIITVVIREFEDFENNVRGTVHSLVKTLEDVKIVVVCDTLPYPPLRLENVPNVRVVDLHPQPDANPLLTKPERHLTTPYVLFVPDGVRLINRSLLSEMIDALEECLDCLIVTQTKGLEGSCHKSVVDLRNWTLHNFDTKTDCNVFDVTHAVLISSKLLFTMNYPFVRPFPYSLFVQAALKKLKVVHMKNLYVFQGKSLFSDPRLSWKAKNLHLRRTAALYKTFGIKKVVRPNNEVEWYGCSKHTQRCFGTVVDDVPDYLLQKRNTPPCCLEALKETGRHVLRILRNAGVRHWLEGGSLLGAARNGDIIPWDYDIDIGIYRDDANKSQQLISAFSQEYVDEKGFVWEKATEGDFFRVQFSKSNHMHVDIFPFVSRAGIMTKNHWFKTHPQDREFPEHFLRPLTTIHFIGMKASAPNNIRDFLELKFGIGAIENRKYPAVLRDIDVEN